MKKVYDSFENGSFCIDIEHARRFGVKHALMITQFKQGADWVFCRKYPDGDGYSRRLKDMLPICDNDAMTIMFSAFEPDKPIPEKLPDIDVLIADAEKNDMKIWITKNEEGGAK